MDGSAQRQYHGRRSRVDDHIVILLLHKDVVEFVHEDELGDARHIRKVLRLDLHFEESEESREDVLNTCDRNPVPPLPGPARRHRDDRDQLRLGYRGLYQKMSESE